MSALPVRMVDYLCLKVLHLSSLPVLNQGRRNYVTLALFVGSNSTEVTATIPLKRQKLYSTLCSAFHRKNAMKSEAKLSADRLK